jgi:hypothetical protein
MKRLVNILLIGLTATLVAAAGPSPAASSDRSASGRGSFYFGHENEGAGYFNFQVARGAETAGKLLFAGEHHDHFPDIVVRVDEIVHANFSPRWVKFTANGFLHDEPVEVRVKAFDGVGTSRPDTFEIRCKNEAGEVILEATGEVFNGDVLIGDSG